MFELVNDWVGMWMERLTAGMAARGGSFHGGGGTRPVLVRISWKLGGFYNT